MHWFPLAHQVAKVIMKCFGPPKLSAFPILGPSYESKLSPSASVQVTFWHRRPQQGPFSDRCKCWPMAQPGTFCSRATLLPCSACMKHFWNSLLPMGQRRLSDIPISQPAKEPHKPCTVHVLSFGLCLASFIGAYALGSKPMQFCRTIQTSGVATTGKVSVHLSHGAGFLRRFRRD